jgi:hypothetical protein
MSERNNQYDDEFEWLETRSQKGYVRERIIEERLFYRKAPEGRFRKNESRSEETQSDHLEEDKNEERDT